MADELDLEKGRPERTEARRKRLSGSSDGESKTATDRMDRELNERLTGALDQVVEWRQARQDAELAMAIDEDKDKMAKGLVSLTHVVMPLRRPLLIFLGFVEPVLAFGRVGRILGERFYERRQRIAEERAMERSMAEQGITVEQWEAQQQPGAMPVP